MIGYELQDRGLIPQRGWDNFLPRLVYALWTAVKVKQETGHTKQRGAEVKKAWSLSSYTPCAFVLCRLGTGTRVILNNRPVRFCIFFSLLSVQSTMANRITFASSLAGVFFDSLNVHRCLPFWFSYVYRSDQRVKVDKHAKCDNTVSCISRMILCSVMRLKG
jgi:hypothetical protein